MAHLELKNVRKAFGAVEVIKGVDKPKPSALGWAVAIAAIFTGLSFIPQLVGILPFGTIYLPLVGAVVGYQISR